MFCYFVEIERSEISLLISYVEGAVEDPSPASSQWKIVEPQEMHNRSEPTHISMHLNDPEIARKFSIYKSVSGPLTLRAIEVYGYQGEYSKWVII